ncbi:Parp1, partial [Symbiodinium sp. KB8]
FFKGITFALSGKLAQTQKAYEELIRRHGGEVSSTVTTSVQFLVSTDEDVKANSHKVALAKGRGTPIVQEGFLGCCIAAKSLLDHCTFLIKASDPAKKREAAKASASPAKKARIAKDEAEPTGSSATASTSVAYATTEAPVIAKSGLGGKAAVVQEQAKKGLMMKGTLTWDVELVLNDPAKGTDKYYNMQLLASTDGSEFWAVQHWGWTGLDGRVHVDGPFKELHAAKAVFRRKYRQKTGNVWGQLGMTFEEMPGKYRLVSLEASGSGHAKGRWQFYMHNAIDGKEVGWYDYDAAAAARLEKYWRQFCDHPDLKLGVRVIHSDYFAYEINFNELVAPFVGSQTERLVAGSGKRRHAKVGKVGCCFWSRSADAGRDDDCESDQGMSDDLSTSAGSWMNANSEAGSSLATIVSTSEFAYLQSAENLLIEAPNETQPDVKPEVPPDSEVLTASGDWSTEASLLAWPKLELQAASRFVSACLIKRELADDTNNVLKIYREMEMACGTHCCAQTDA